MGAGANEGGGIGFGEVDGAVLFEVDAGAGAMVGVGVAAGVVVGMGVGIGGGVALTVNSEEPPTGCSTLSESLRTPAKEYAPCWADAVTV